MEIAKSYAPLIANAFNYKYRYFAFLSGRLGNAKSTNIARCLLIIGMTKKVRIACVRETQNSIKDSVHAQLSEEITANELPYEIYKESIVCPLTGTEIIFRGLRETNEHNIRSMANIDVAFIEEGQAISATSFDSFDPTIRKKGSFIIIAGNPDQESDIIYQMFGPQAERRDDTYYCYLNYEYNNFKLPDSVLQNIALMKKNRPGDYERIYLGMLRKHSDRPVVRSWNPEKNIGIGKESHTIFWSLDFNVNPQCSVICHWDGAHDFYFSDEIVLENASTYKVAEEFVRIYRSKYNGRPLVINGDASGRNRSSNSEFSNYAIIEQVLTDAHIRFDLQVPRANTSISNRVNNFDWHVHGVDGRPHILVNPDCRHLCHACKLLSYDANGKIIEIPAKFGMQTIDYAKSHIFDAASYCVFANDPVLEGFVSTPKPQTQTIRDMWERDLQKVAGAGVFV